MFCPRLVRDARPIRIPVFVICSTSHAFQLAGHIWGILCQQPVHNFDDLSRYWLQPKPGFHLRREITS